MSSARRDVPTGSAHDGYAAEEEQDWGGLPVISASQRRAQPSRTQPGQQPERSSFEAHDGSEEVPSLREMLSTLDADDFRRSFDEQTSAARADIRADEASAGSSVRGPSPERKVENKLAEAAQLNPDAPTWSFMKAKITGAAESETSRVKAFEDAFEEVENSILRAPARQGPPPKRSNPRPQPQSEQQPIRMTMNQSRQGWDVSGDGAWEVHDGGWEFPEYRPLELPQTVPRLMALQLGVDRDRGRGSGRGRGRAGGGERPAGTPAGGQQHHFSWEEEQLPWEEPAPWDRGPQHVRQMRERMLPQPQTGQHRAERDAWQQPAQAPEQAPAAAAERQPGVATETLPGMRGLRKPGVPPPVKRTAGSSGRDEISGMGSPLEYAPLKCSRCLEPTYCTVDITIDDCWQTY
mmetsp:Transcript_110437/g.344278  ORF Transcript_110437/g.344278 Transcript_110437/m.344278 type:complete len:407 (+) Transcript_110437:96-1316(+)